MLLSTEIPNFNAVKYANTTNDKSIETKNNSYQRDSKDFPFRANLKQVLTGNFPIVWPLLCHLQELASSENLSTSWQPAAQTEAGV